jgi:hypothetical protein
VSRRQNGLLQISGLGWSFCWLEGSSVIATYP